MLNARSVPNPPYPTIAVGATLSIDFPIPQVLSTNIALSFRGDDRGSIPPVDRPPSKGTREGSGDNDDTEDHSPQGSLNRFAALPFPPDESRRAYASKGEKNTQDRPGQCPGESAAQPVSSGGRCRSQIIGFLRYEHCRSADLIAGGGGIANIDLWYRARGPARRTPGRGRTAPRRERPVG
jgi:hypothetical protein